ncbi:hypothetical protein [Aquimarina latercula]|uniref:hypothetical protein n=1 Tax=Aquimarina latercula TaxID=987 RepID=UPI00041395D1|nr:hypothetical protein [Aquimarina latercula]
MKNVLIILFSVLSLTSCKNRNVDDAKKTKSETPMNFNQEQTYYKIKLSSSLPYKLLLNDLIIDEDNGEEGGAVETNLFANNLILNSGIQHLKIVLFPKKDEDSITQRSLDYIKIALVKLNLIDSKDSELIKEFNIKNANSGSGNSYQWEFISVIPYKINGWSNSVNLIKQDQKELLKEVIEFYKKTYDVLNSGDSSKFLDMVSKRNEETAIAFYNNPGVLQEKEELAQRVKEAKGKMNPLQDFTIKFYGNGRIVTLENKNGDSPLYYSTEDYDDFFSIQLHRPKDGEPLEIIR